MEPKQVVMEELLAQIPEAKTREEKELFCSGCVHFPFTGKQVQLCSKVGWRVAATDGVCIHYQRRPKKRMSKTIKQTILPREMWKRCSKCGRWLKTKESIEHGIGRGCQKKLVKEKHDKRKGRLMIDLVALITQNEIGGDFRGIDSS